MKFWKMNGAGNDFIILNNIEEKLPHNILPQLAKTLCERHLSIGADGLMVVESATQGGDYKMLFFNSDGSIGEMCGNGARCICRYGYENNLAGETQVVETTAGIVTGYRIDKRLYRIRLNDPTTIVLDAEVIIDGVKVECSYIELGNPGLPHAVIPYQNLKEADTGKLREFGEKLRWYNGFSKGANINFYEILGNDYIYERTYERGVEDFTYACGTGTACVVAALSLKEKVSGGTVKADMKGGTLFIDLTKDGEQITDILLTGPTNIVCIGDITDETLSL
ncbi:diaminopimelate epimerase [Oscillospiraceae bacterium LTW-04]|nr:diaminopimelate epimerase [Oscillospiraceae bacterium MB24-C1]